jgi:Trypsin-co-occurring domain 1
MTESDPGPVLVQVVPIEDGREILWGSNKIETLEDRLDDIKEAITSGARAVADSLQKLRGSPGWQVKEVSGTFGLSLSAEAGVILTKASTEATFEVTVTFERTGDTSAPDET